MQLLQFNFWRQKSPTFWEILKANHLCFFEDDGEIALSGLASTILQKPDQFTAEAAGKAFRFRALSKATFSTCSDLLAKVFYKL